MKPLQGLYRIYNLTPGRRVSLKRSAPGLYISPLRGEYFERLRLAFIATNITHAPFPRQEKHLDILKTALYICLIDN